MVIEAGIERIFKLVDIAGVDHHPGFIARKFGRVGLVREKAVFDLSLGIGVIVGLRSAGQETGNCNSGKALQV